MALRITVPGSKSMTQRALLLAALDERPSRIVGAIRCDDSSVLTHILECMGTRLEWKNNEVRVQPASLHAPKNPLSCGNAGTAIRFAACLSLLLDGPIVLDGDQRMRQRPIDILGGALRSLGVNVRYINHEGFPPIRLCREGEIAETVSVDASQSSQFASGLMMVASRLPKGLTVSLTGQAVSRPYMDMTIKMMRRYGAEISETDSNTFFVQPTPCRPSAFGDIMIEPDWSSAAFLLAAGFISKVSVEVPGVLPREESLQGDAVFTNMLEELREPREHTFDLRDHPDLIAPLAAAATAASHKTHITTVEHARIKESDRIAVLCESFARIGIKIDERKDGLTVHPSLPRQGAISDFILLDPRNDHRMAMAFGLLTLRFRNIEVLCKQCVGKSYPDFWDALALIKREKELMRL